MHISLNDLMLKTYEDHPSYMAGTIFTHAAFFCLATHASASLTAAALPPTTSNLIAWHCPAPGLPVRHIICFLDSSNPQCGPVLLAAAGFLSTPASAAAGFLASFAAAAFSLAAAFAFAFAAATDAASFTSMDSRSPGSSSSSGSSPSISESSHIQFRISILIFDFDFNY